MSYDQLSEEMVEIYKDYAPEYAYSFNNGMIYASFITKEISEDQMHELNNWNTSKFQSVYDSRRNFLTD